MPSATDCQHRAAFSSRHPACTFSSYRPVPRLPPSPLSLISPFPSTLSFPLHTLPPPSSLHPSRSVPPSIRPSIHPSAPFALSQLSAPAPFSYQTQLFPPSSGRSPQSLPRIQSETACRLNPPAPAALQLLLTYLQPTVRSSPAHNCPPPTFPVAPPTASNAAQASRTRGG